MGCGVCEECCGVWSAVLWINVRVVDCVVTSLGLDVSLHPKQVLSLS